MKTNLLVAIGLLILFGVIGTAFGIWYLSHTSEFQRTDTPAAASGATGP